MQQCPYQVPATRARVVWKACWYKTKQHEGEYWLRGWVKTSGRDYMEVYDEQFYLAAFMNVTRYP